MIHGGPSRSVGQTVLEAIRATRRVTATNTNLGIVLLLAPLVAVSPEDDLRRGLAEVLDRLDVADSVAVYQAIRLAVPGGLGKVPEQDVRDEPTLPLRSIMALAADRGDLVARQYCNGFVQVFEEGVPFLQTGLKLTGDLEKAIIYCHLSVLSVHPDSLIVRKLGWTEAAEASRRAQRVLEAGWPAAGQELLQELDDWLRACGHQRNPGTTADLVTACLFVALRQRIITLPVTFSAAPLNLGE